MRSLFFLVSISILVVACNDSDKKQVNSAIAVDDFEKLEQLDWILGNWSNINSETESYEQWVKSNDSIYIGASVTLRNADTVFAERMKLYQESGTVFLYVETVGSDPNPVVFTQRPNAEHFFTFENPRNSFPTEIIYTNPEPQKIHAWVSGIIADQPQRSEFYLVRDQ